MRGLSLRALGRASNTSHSFIADIEAGRSKPSIDTLTALAKALGISLADLMGDNNSTPSWWHRDTPPTNVELEEFLKTANIYFDGAPLNEEDKEDIITYLKVKWEREKKKRTGEKRQ